jgi:hypothetical protein
MPLKEPLLAAESQLHIICMYGTICNSVAETNAFYQGELRMLGRPKRDVTVIRQIKEWAYACLPVSSEATLSVMELECREPGCPPLETVIAAMEEGKGTRQWKLHKPIPDVTRADLDELAAKEPSAGS